MISAEAALQAQGDGQHAGMTAIAGTAQLAGTGTTQRVTIGAGVLAGVGVIAVTRGVFVLPGVPDYRFPIVARTLAQLLIAQQLSTTGRVGSETPADLQTRMPFVRIDRIGGSSDWVNDYAVVDIEVFATTFVDAEQRAEYIRQYLVFADLPAIEGYGLLDRVECLTGPQELPWADDQVRRFGATYRITSRRRRIR